MNSLFLVILFHLWFIGETFVMKPGFKIVYRRPVKMVGDYHPFGRKYYEEYLKKLNSKNTTLQTETILNNNSTGYTLDGDDDLDDELEDNLEKMLKKALEGVDSNQDLDLDDTKKTFIRVFPPNVRIILKKKGMPDKDQHDMFAKHIQEALSSAGVTGVAESDGSDDGHYYNPDGTLLRTRRKNKAGDKSENFEVITKSPLTFEDIGGYSNIKKELSQCVDILSNYKKYKNYNVRVPKGLLLEGPPGNGKTMLAKGFAGETNASFIPVSGSQFQDKYVGVGSTRVRELFELARRNLPCIIFIDEIDAIGRKRGTDGESSTSERDNTLNELLINLDGFKTGSGVFLMGATNRADLLDPALLRPGRIDKRIFIGNPDSATREAILNIHLTGKPSDKTVVVKDLVDVTSGLSGAQIENLLNEGMLNALRDDRAVMTYNDLDVVMNKIMVGWQPTEHQFSADLIDRIAIHEMGHAVMGFLSKHHSKLSKVVINLSAPNSPGYTIFEQNTNSIYKREALFEHLMISLSGRIAEEIVYGVSVTTGAINDFEEAFRLAEKMIVYYGMGSSIIYPKTSEKYKELIDDEVSKMIQDAYNMATVILRQCCYLIIETADILKSDKIIRIEMLKEIIETKYPEVLDLKIDS